MTLIFRIHSDNPQERLLLKTVDCLKKGGVIVYPTDSGYALGGCLGHKKVIDRIRKIRKLNKNHNFTLMCSGLSELATYAKIDNPGYRLLKSHLPGSYTFIMKATNEVPRLLLHPKRRSIGLRVPAFTITQSLLALLGQPMISTSLILPDDEEPLNDIEDIERTLFGHVDIILDGGFCCQEPTTIVSLVEDYPEIIREGKADSTVFA